MLMDPGSDNSFCSGMYVAPEYVPPVNVRRFMADVTFGLAPVVVDGWIGGGMNIRGFDGSGGGTGVSSLSSLGSLSVTL